MECVVFRTIKNQTQSSCLKNKIKTNSWEYKIPVVLVMLISETPRKPATGFLLSLFLYSF
jgi:hypothetical protein